MARLHKGRQEYRANTDKATKSDGRTTEGKIREQIQTRLQKIMARLQSK